MTYIPAMVYSSNSIQYSYSYFSNHYLERKFQNKIILFFQKKVFRLSAPYLSSAFQDFSFFYYSSHFLYLIPFSHFDGISCYHLERKYLIFIFLSDHIFDFFHVKRYLLIDFGIFTRFQMSKSIRITKNLYREQGRWNMFL